MLSFLCTVDDVKRLIKDEKNYDRDKVYESIPDYSERISRLLGYDFEPILEKITIVPNQLNVNPRMGLLTVGKPILELISVNIGGEALTIGTDVELYPPGSIEPPKKLRIITNRCGSWSSICSGNALFKIEVVAWTGFQRYADTQGFRETGFGLPSVLPATSTPVLLEDIEDVEGYDLDGFKPRFSSGNLWRIGDEMLRVADTPDDQSCLLLRGQRGTVPALHAQNDPVLIWSPYRIIRRAVRLWTHLSYSRDSYATVRIDGMGATSEPVDMPGEVANVIQQFHNERNAVTF